MPGVAQSATALGQDAGGPAQVADRRRRACGRCAPRWSPTGRWFPWERTRSASSWASSTTRTWWSGRTPGCRDDHAEHGVVGDHDLVGSGRPRRGQRSGKHSVLRQACPGTRPGRPRPGPRLAGRRRGRDHRIHRCRCRPPIHRAETHHLLPRLASAPWPATGWATASPTSRGQHRHHPADSRRPDDGGTGSSASP